MAAINDERDALKVLATKQASELALLKDVSQSFAKEVFLLKAASSLGEQPRDAQCSRQCSVKAQRGSFLGLFFQRINGHSR